MYSILSHLLPGWLYGAKPPNKSPHHILARMLISFPLLQASTNYKEAFALFDKRGNGRVALQSLGDLLRACGQNPTLAEIKDLERSVGGDCEYIFSSLYPYPCMDLDDLNIVECRC